MSVAPAPVGLTLTDCSKHWPDLSVGALHGDQLGPARSQGARETCLAFATSAAHGCTLGRPDELSVEWLYCCAKKRDGGAHEAVEMHVIRDALEQDGQAEEHVWPYDESRSYRDPAYAIPADPTITVYRRASNSVAPSFGDIVAALSAGWTPILGIGTTLAFYAATATHGIVADPPAGSPIQSLHAVLGVGWGTHADGTRYVIIRNSWGPAWGIQGYALVSESYLASQLLEVFRPM